MRKVIAVLVVFMLVFFCTTGIMKHVMTKEVDNLIRSADWALSTGASVILHYENGASEVIMLKRPVVEIVELVVLEIAVLTAAIMGTRTIKKVQ